MVHKVIPEIDAGETVLTASVPIMETDTLSQLEDKMHQAEHKLLVQAVNKVLSSYLSSLLFFYFLFCELKERKRKIGRMRRKRKE